MKKIFVIVTVSVLVVFLSNLPARLYLKAKRMGWVNSTIPIAAIDDSTIVFLVAGQSTAANSGEKRFTAHRPVYNFWDGKLYTASDPLIGSDGGGGSPWCLLGDMLIDSGLAKKVVIVPVAQGGTSVKDWAAGKCKPLLEQAMRQLGEQDVQLDFFIWQQGESDVRRAQHYKQDLQMVIDNVRQYQQVPVLMSITSYNHVISDSSAALRSVQQKMIDSLEYVLQGPDTDAIPDRHDGQHFSAKGLQLLAAAWYQSLKESRLLITQQVR